uniref:Flocculation protein FLO11-like n=1 Tax=Saccoglossus kowalevskii TaxID=10224 RepID=A0ABM0MFK9_SACKO|nr:PREDICTED: flocculation protein FLO11-like [Saccoglossus kowalevskii]
MPSMCTTIVVGLLQMVLPLINVHGYPTGAPTSACETMIPGHVRTSAQTIPAPYSIHLSSSMYSFDEPLIVTITGELYKGILLQARPVQQTTPYGTFLTPPRGLHSINCTNPLDSLTHSMSIFKKNTSFTWTPSSNDVGDIEFVATIAQNHNVYWIGVKSTVVGNADSYTPRVTVTKATTEETTAKVATTTYDVTSNVISTMVLVTTAAATTYDFASPTTVPVTSPAETTHDITSSASPTTALVTTAAKTTYDITSSANPTTALVTTAAKTTYDITSSANPTTALITTAAETTYDITSNVIPTTDVVTTAVETTYDATSSDGRTTAFLTTEITTYDAQYRANKTTASYTTYGASSSAVKTSDVTPTYIAVTLDPSTTNDQNDGE